MVEKIFNLDKKMKVVVLANSFKEGGRCLAGIEIDNQSNPKKLNNRPKWIRPICDTAHCEVPTHLVSHINLLDIIEFTPVGDFATGYQSENIKFDENSLKVIGRLEINKLSNFCDNSMRLIFGNKGKAVAKEQIEYLSYSLILIKVTSFEITQKVYPDNPHPQIRIVFNFNNINYDLPITDPVFLHKYQTNNNVLQNINELFLILSLGVEYKEWYYKLAAAIIFEEIIENSNTEEEDDLPF